METKTTTAVENCKVRSIQNYTPITVSANFRALEYLKCLKNNGNNVDAKLAA
jgi:hypothetical protein